MTINSKNKHLTLDDRNDIQRYLDCGMSFKAIAAKIGKDPTTVSKEIKKHLKVRDSSFNLYKTDGSKKVPFICALLVKAPFVCNPCVKRHQNCGFQKQFYNAKFADSEYRTLLVESREGIPLNKDYFYHVDRIISSGLKKGQHIYHILKAHDLKVSSSTVYRHFKKGYFSYQYIDLPRAVKFKPRRKSSEKSIPKATKLNRSYDDFLAQSFSSWVEMDTLIGRVGGKTILTLNFSFCNFIAALLLEDKSSAQVSQKIINLKKAFASNRVAFGDIFPVILTDNGGEFADVFSIENDIHGHKESSVFFCDPYQASQKPRVEKNHTLFRDIVPKGHSFDSFTQDTVNLIFSNINSVRRKSLNGKSAYELFSFTYSELIAELLGIVSIPDNEVVQSPKLLKS